ncbi:DUF4919 domain-containing protein [Chryseobacterium geocarposphaerae]|uniref:Uncharacterized protein DUF4919 n=1 Tax=Chryseobacterium geocarposphaerae TaxID=1416776 RepID=A0A2M9C206_9FLAO|nr:DUF4919 domain-containing protein [Chryseobacterium geocarposphaerae]PJJ64433.1 uncharacterized protein DUF4919 [Chryseobacterium geocarposphaerae]
MKYIFLLYCFLFSVSGFSQKFKIDFKNIEKNSNDPRSPYNYEKLIFKFKGLPKSIDSIEAQHLYYGRNFRDIISTEDESFKSLAEAFKNKDWENSVSLGKVLYYKDPTNLDVLLILLRSYDSKQDVNNFVYHLSQFRLLADAIRNSGDGKTEKTAYNVNSVGDEYILLNMMNIGMDYTRSSKEVKGGMLDIWEKENNKMYTKVLYLRN